MKIVFMGTPDFAAIILKALIECTAHTVEAVVTQPDRPKGRGKQRQCPPVKDLAVRHAIPVLQPETLRGKQGQAALKDYKAEVFVVAAYGLLLPKRVLDMPPLGCLNIHASLLPKYRGAAPMQYALLQGDCITGITIMYMARGMDTGDIILQQELPIGCDERLASLHDRMAALGGECIKQVLELAEAGQINRIPQDAQAVTYAPMLQKTDGHIDWHKPTERIVNMTRALDPWPGPYTAYEGQTLKIWRVEPVDANILSGTVAGAGFASASPGIILAVNASRGILVKTGDSALWVTEVQSTGGKRMAAVDFLRGHVIEPGKLLG